MTVPVDARAAVDAARDWPCAFFLWDTEPSTMPPHPTRHTGGAHMREIEIVGTAQAVTDGPLGII